MPAPRPYVALHIRPKSGLRPLPTVAGNPIQLAMNACFMAVYFQGGTSGVCHKQMFKLGNEAVSCSAFAAVGGGIPQWLQRVDQRSLCNMLASMAASLDRLQPNSTHSCVSPVFPYDLLPRLIHLLDDSHAPRRYGVDDILSP